MSRILCASCTHAHEASKWKWNGSNAPAAFSIPEKGVCPHSRFIAFVCDNYSPKPHAAIINAIIDLEALLDKIACLDLPDAKAREEQASASASLRRSIDELKCLLPDEEMVQAHEQPHELVLDD